MASAFSNPDLARLVVRWVGSLSLSLHKVSVPYAAGMRDRNAALARMTYVCARAFCLHMEAMFPELRAPLYQRSAGELRDELDRAYAARGRVVS